MASSWLELSSVVEPEAADAVAEVFGRWGHGVAIDQPVRDAPDGEGGSVDPAQNVVVKTYLPVDQHVEASRRLLEEAVWHLGRLRHVEPLQTRGLAEEDWAHAWKRCFFPHRIGRRLVVVPSWRRGRYEARDVVIRLDPGMAFGTGLHPTTRMCLQLLEEHVRRGDRVLDFGCGSGILSIAAALLGAAGLLALDVDSAAVRVAEENARRNRVARRITVSLGSVETDPTLPQAPFDLIVANISALVLKNAEPGLAAVIRSGGLLILSGLLQKKASDVGSLYVSRKWELLETRGEGDWAAIVVRRRKSSRG
jgi:ribosomal protein L11 methyltransferase